MLGSNHILLLANMTSAADQSPSSSTLPLASQAPLDGSLTTIILPSNGNDDDANDSDMSALLAAMPSRRDSDILVEECKHEVVAIMLHDLLT